MNKNNIFPIAIGAFGLGASRMESWSDDNSVLVELANKYNKTQNQILLNYYVYEKRLLPITKANKIEHINLNLEVLNFRMEQEDYNKLNEFRCKEFDRLEVDWQDNGGVSIYKFANQVE